MRPENLRDPCPWIFPEEWSSEMRKSNHRGGKRADPIQRHNNNATSIVKEGHYTLPCNNLKGYLSRESYDAFQRRNSIPRKIKIPFQL